MYGYEIAKAVKAEGKGGLIFKQGAIYPVLRSLHATGLPGQPGRGVGLRPARRYYNITDDGRKALSEWQFAGRGMREFVDDALKAGGIDHDFRPSAWKRSRLSRFSSRRALRRPPAGLIADALADTEDHLNNEIANNPGLEGIEILAVP